MPAGEAFVFGDFAEDGVSWSTQATENRTRMQLGGARCTGRAKLRRNSDANNCIVSGLD
jgi:hypothetical protein